MQEVSKLINKRIEEQTAAAAVHNGLRLSVVSLTLVTTPGGHLHDFCTANLLRQMCDGLRNTSHIFTGTSDPNS